MLTLLTFNYTSSLGGLPIDRNCNCGMNYDMTQYSYTKQFANWTTDVYKNLTYALQASKIFVLSAVYNVNNDIKYISNNTSYCFGDFSAFATSCE